MKGYGEKFLSELKNKNDIASVVSKYVRLEQRGGNLWGKCPFHHEKTASFCVNTAGQFFYCFGCHKSGDVITFVREMESLDFQDAVKLLAERAHMPMPDVQYDDSQLREQKKRKERILALLKDAARFYAANLRSEGAEKHIEYILKRKITSEYVANFGLGASLDYYGLPRHLSKLGYTLREMVDSGAVGERGGKPYDALGGRLIIPVIDQFGSVIAFCGRIIEDKKGVGKYVNTRETKVFSKGKTLFNLNNLKKVKNEKGLDSIIVVEGHMDAVSLVQAGFSNVVASMGTALTKDQARILKRYADKVFISYDGDFAGQKAAVRGLEILSEEGLDVKVVSLPEGMDPDDVIKKQGAEGYKKCLDEALPLIDFKLAVLQKTYDLTTADGKRKYASAAAAVIRESPSPAEQEDLLKQVRDSTGYTFEALKRELYSAEEKPAVPPPNLAETAADAGDRLAMASRFVLYACIFKKPYADWEDFNSLEFPLPVHAALRDYVAEAHGRGEKVNFSDLFERFGEEYGAELSLLAAMETDERLFYGETYYADCVKTLKRAAIEKKLQLLYSRYDGEKESGQRREIAAEMQSLLAEKQKLERQGR